VYDLVIHILVTVLMLFSKDLVLPGTRLQLSASLMLFTVASMKLMFCSLGSCLML